MSNSSHRQTGAAAYNRFSGMATDMVNVRIYHGVHFRTADEVGRTQGRQVAEWVFRHTLQPLGNKEKHD